MTWALVVSESANPTTVAMAFVMVVLFVASAGPLWAALLTSLAAMLCFNFFFLPPVGTWHVNDPQNWIALVALLATSIVASQLSARARARAEERRRADIATERAALSSALLAAMGHDLRTPLTALRVAIDNLTDPALSATARAEQAGLARRQAAQLTRVFDGILDMARIESRTVQVGPEWCSPADIVHAAVSRVAPALDRHRVSVVIDGDEDVRVDPRLTAAALANVLENAARYSPAGSTIHIRSAAGAGGIRLSVADEGPGLDRDEVAELFSPLFRGKAGRAAGGGTGMGLAIARGLITAQNGSIRAEDTIQGATFVIEIPAERREAAVEAPSA